MQINWRGVYPAVTTQFNRRRFSIDHAANANMLEQLIEEGRAWHYRLWHRR